MGLNQAICWTAVCGTGILAAALGGYMADSAAFDRLRIGLALVRAAEG